MFASHKKVPKSNSIWVVRATKAQIYSMAKNGIFMEKLSHDKKSFANSICQLVNIKEYDNKSILGVKIVLASCGIPMVDTYVNYISDVEFKKYIKRQCEDLAIWSWHTMLHTTSLRDCYMEVKHRLLLEPYLHKLNGKQEIQFSQFRSAPYMSSRERITDNHSQGCPLCCKQCKADEYHLTMVFDYRFVTLEIKGLNFFQKFITRIQI